MKDYKKLIQNLIELTKKVLKPILPILLLIPVIAGILIALIISIGDSEDFTGSNKNDQNSSIAANAKSAIITNDDKPTAPAVTAEIADTNQERETGLMNRESLGEKAGMLFVFDKPQQLNFWMKNTYISLDIIFINQDNEIVQIAKNAEPLNTDKIYSSEKNALYALEVNGGFSDKNKYSIGDKLTIKFKQ